VVALANCTSVSTFNCGAGDSDYKVVSALLPEKLESWMGEEQEEPRDHPLLNFC
jgi:hypothetical protein